jgi:hypothetical protein
LSQIERFYACLCLMCFFVAIVSALTARRPRTPRRPSRVGRQSDPFFCSSKPLDFQHSRLRFSARHQPDSFRDVFSEQTRTHRGINIK